MQQLLAAPYTAKLTRAYPRDMRENIHTEFLMDIPERERGRWSVRKSEREVALVATNLCAASST